MKNSYIVLFFSIVVASLFSGCGTVSSYGPPAVLQAPIPPGQPGFENQKVRVIEADTTHNLFHIITYRGIGDTLTVINNSNYLISLNEGSVWIYPHTRSSTVSLDAVAKSYSSATAHLLVDVYNKDTKQHIITVPSHQYSLTPIYPGYFNSNNLQDYIWVVTDDQVKQWLQGQGYNNY
jgi:hypothetical protein